MDAAAPLVMQAGSGRLAGVDPRFAEESQRSGTFGSLRLALKAGDHGLEFGLSALRSNHTLDPLAGSRLWGGDGDVFDSDWVGYASRYGNTLGAREFGTTRFTLFVEDTWNAAPGVRVRAGGRWTQEGLPDEVDNDESWQVASGVELPGAATSASGLAGHVAVDWAPPQAGGLGIL